MLQCGQVVKRVEVEAWATPREGMKLIDLVPVLKELGDEILEIDVQNNRIKVLRSVEEL